MNIMSKIYLYLSFYTSSLANTREVLKRSNSRNVFVHNFLIQAYVNRSKKDSIPTKKCFMAKEGEALQLGFANRVDVDPSQSWHRDSRSCMWRRRKTSSTVVSISSSFFPVSDLLSRRV